MIYVQSGVSSGKVKNWNSAEKTGIIFIYKIYGNVIENTPSIKNWKKKLVS